MEDSELLKRISKGESKAFSILLDRYKSQVFGVCFFLMKEQALAEDLSQETWIKVVKACDDYQPVAPVSAWIKRIARNACLNELRTRNRWTELSIEDESRIMDEQLGIDELIEKVEDDAKLKTALLDLPPQQKLALMLVIEEEKSHAEIALELNCSVGAVKVLLFRARENLKKRWEES